jgi:hypothetical protein
MTGKGKGKPGEDATRKGWRYKGAGKRKKQVPRFV